MRKLFAAILVLALAVPTLSFAADLEGDANYKAKCAACHGANGEGKPAMKTAPLKDSAGKSEADLTAAIENGTSKDNIKMPGYKDKLTADQIKALVAEIKALK